MVTPTINIDRLCIDVIPEIQNDFRFECIKATWKLWKKYRKTLVYRIIQRLQVMVSCVWMFIDIGTDIYQLISEYYKALWKIPNYGKISSGYFYFSGLMLLLIYPLQLLVFFCLFLYNDDIDEMRETMINTKYYCPKKLYLTIPLQFVKDLLKQIKFENGICSILLLFFTVPFFAIFVAYFLHPLLCLGYIFYFIGYATCDKDRKTYLIDEAKNHGDYQTLLWYHFIRIGKCFECVFVALPQVIINGIYLSNNWELVTDESNSIYLFGKNVPLPVLSFFLSIGSVIIGVIRASMYCVKRFRPNIDDDDSDTDSINGKNIRSEMTEIGQLCGFDEIEKFNSLRVTTTPKITPNPSPILPKQNSVLTFFRPINEHQT